MKLSFDKWESEYIGNEFAEYRNAGFFQDISLKSAIKRRKNTITIKYADTHLFEWVMKLYNEKKIEEQEIGVRNIINNFVYLKFKSNVDKADFTKIKKFITLEIPELTDYIDDFVLLFIYVSDKCFLEEDYVEKREKINIKKETNRIRRFFSEIVEKRIDVEKITIEYNKDQYGYTKKLVINAPILIKIMLYQFAKRYFVAFENNDAENWENEINQRSEKIKRGRPKKYNTDVLAAILQLYFLFIDNEEIINKTSTYKKYYIIGRLLSFAGYDKYNELGKADYKSANDFYYKRLSRIWKYEEK